MLPALKTEAYRNLSVSLLSESIQIDTQVFDDSGTVANDPRFERFQKFIDFLDARFPALHTAVKHEPVNTYARLYTWQGADPTLRPALLMAHADTVPATEAGWTHPPFSGHFDGQYIWGRGSSDDKNSLVGMLEAITGLLEGGFRPNRTLLLAFGIDEELMRNDNEGASKLATRMEELYGPDGIEMILDEGGLGVQSLGDTKQLFVLPSLVEKGYLDVSIRLRTTGGHSSKPPRHTGIGIMADLITRLEAKGDPFQPDLASTDYTLTCLHCFADHAPSFSKKLSKLVKRGVSGRKLAQALIAEMPAWKPLVVNTQAVDVIRGGIKANALPEETTITINYRVAPHSSIEEIETRAKSLALQVAKAHQLSSDAFEVRLVNPLPPAPRSPTDNPTYAKFAGGLRSFYGNHSIVAPASMFGNTDTKAMWRLSKNIYRFTPALEGAPADNIHGVDERIPLAAHINAVRFYFQMIRVLTG